MLLATLALEDVELLWLELPWVAVDEPAVIVGPVTSVEIDEDIEEVEDATEDVEVDENVEMLEDVVEEVGILGRSGNPITRSTDNADDDPDAVPRKS